MEKLSVQLSNLSERAAGIENRANAARQEGAEKRDAAIASAKADAKAKQEAFNAQVSSANDTARSRWQAVRESFTNNSQKAQEGIKSRKEAVDLRMTKDRVALLEVYAEDAVAFALIAMNEAEIAVLDAIDARLHLEDMENA